MAGTTNKYPCNVLENIFLQSHFIPEDLVSQAVSGHNATDKTPMFEMPLTLVFGVLRTQTVIEKSSVSLPNEINAPGRITYRLSQLLEERCNGRGSIIVEKGCKIYEILLLKYNNTLFIAFTAHTFLLEPQVITFRV